MFLKTKKVDRNCQEKEVESYGWSMFLVRKVKGKKAMALDENGFHMVVLT